jgi:hypothetical protein
MSKGDDKILLVEGESDRAFFEQVCKTLGLNTVTVAPPRALTGTHNTKQGVFNYLPFLMSQLADGRTRRLAVVVDADSVVNGGGFAKTIQTISEIVNPHGFTQCPSPQGGIVFRHKDGLADFGLWVMPNNSAEGTLEDWFKQCIVPVEQKLLSHAEAAVAALPPPTKFKTLHRCKAEVATWLAWQKQPGHGMYRAVEDGLLDTKNAHFQKFVAWMGHVYT